tara:strand:+ start:694 stop:1077 length:384 start_codon:yes stop_codon:yes gene_type:complete
VQIAVNGTQKKHSLPYKFPYKAMNPMTTKEQTFNSIDDVYDVLEECYDKCVEKGYSRLGEALYKQSLFIANDVLFIDQKSQDKLKAYRFCKKFNCPPYPSLQETPIDTIDSFNIIDEEIEKFRNKES